ncbi:DUF4229 domain-containing protein [Arthrobacter agilis]|uniref:DUF4229 domain-containing protein n=1 Tax=Arthrobacter agilis TaxID=37921 RepID=UPI000B35F6B1|nr:DUF4229 domain-containing protein [Arthrobacter agilis]OUM42996.1 hypothetical protein B8W74_07020 [Arthrobacter agilis]PPB45941.1 DUF4229 domain-containing protein [Arthrobacter agilis]TPV25482.1 DUF4229 domain-containing protein [Arthrobacter agilis]WDF32859.1 DUF4229 domain-containing protein [Arthrobacter agilis]VDR33224.1 Uncharacterised protein [Arthrobacter agilis]
MAFLKFSALRLLLIVVFYVACMLLGLGIFFSAVVAAILAWCVTYLFARDLRDAAAATLQRRLTPGAPPVRTAVELDDAAAEDALDPNTPVNTDRKRR